MSSTVTFYKSKKNSLWKIYVSKTKFKKILLIPSLTDNPC